MLQCKLDRIAQAGVLLEGVGEVDIGPAGFVPGEGGYGEVPLMDHGQKSFPASKR